MLDKISGNSYCFLGSSYQTEHHLWLPLAAFTVLYLVSPYQSNYGQSSHKFMAESGTHMTNHNHHQPLEELPCPPEASSHRAAPLPSAVTTAAVSQVTPMLPWDVGTKAIAVHLALEPLLTSLHFQHLPCSGGTCSCRHWPPLLD